MAKLRVKVDEWQDWLRKAACAPGQPYLNFRVYEEIRKQRVSQFELSPKVENDNFSGKSAVTSRTWNQSRGLSGISRIHKILTMKLDSLAQACPALDKRPCCWLLSHPQPVRKASKKLGRSAAFGESGLLKS
jgi:hypothetical protein